jgi:hypothetical protein
VKHAIALAAALSALSSSALAHADPPADQVERSEGYASHEIHLGAGARGLLLPDAGYQPYSNSEVMFQFALTGGVTFLRAGNVSLIVFGEWDVGQTSAVARDAQAALTMHRIGGGLEARFGLGRRFFLGVKAAPAAIRLYGSIEESGTSGTLLARPWTWALDTTGTAGLLLGSVAARRGPVRFWIGAEVGYAFAGQATMAFAPDEDSNDTRHFGSVMLPPFRPSGGVTRLSAMMSF